jgi:hypothetical protein
VHSKHESRIELLSDHADRPHKEGIRNSGAIEIGYPQPDVRIVEHQHCKQSVRGEEGEHPLEVLHDIGTRRLRLILVARGLHLTRELHIRESERQPHMVFAAPAAARAG